MASVLTALLPVVLSMMASRSGSASGAGAASTGGGLGDLLGQVLGGADRGGRSGGGAGGLGDLLEHFQRAGFGEQARSWVGTGQNQAIPPEAFDRVFGRDGIAEIARRAGVPERDAARGLSELLPEVVDHVTPGGQVPEAGSLADSVDALTRRLDVA